MAALRYRKSSGTLGAALKQNDNVIINEIFAENHKYETTSRQV